jgi:hypothetical protein
MAGGGVGGTAGFLCAVAVNKQAFTNKMDALNRRK